MKRVLSAVTGIAIIACASSAFAAQNNASDKAGGCPQSVCISNGINQGHAPDKAKAWCKVNAKNLVGPTCAYK
jgi:hypothetical protein